MLPTDQTPTITSDALITAVAFMPAFSPSSSAASLVIDEVIVTVGDTSIVTWVVVAPGFTCLDCAGDLVTGGKLHGAISLE